MNGWQVEGFNEVSELGSGAQGRVVLAVPEGHSRQVAIKYLAPALLSDEETLGVFRREAETLARVTDPHVARLFQYVERPQGAAIVMEAVAGASLREVLDRQDGGLAPEAALAVLKGSLLGLAAAHAVGVVHRDYKPANVVVQPDGASKLIDFGIAVLSGQSSRAGTPAYMAPEQWQGDPASPATDLYAASCVFFECLTGAKPYQGGGTAQLMAQHLNAPVPLETVPEPVRPLLARGLAKNPGQRLWNAAEFAAELEHSAVAAYGPDWEQRGIRALAVAAAALATAAPAAMLGSFAAEGAAPATSAAPAAPAAQQSMASAQQGAAAESGQAAARHSRGFLRRAGGTKTVIGAAVVTAAAATGGGFLIAEQGSDSTTQVSPSARAASGSPSPTPTTVGGRATGQLTVGFRNPEPFRAERGPSMAYDFTAEPARVKQGTKLSLTVNFTSRNPPIWHSWHMGRDTGSKMYLYFYRVPPAAEGTPPTGTGERVSAQWDEAGEAQGTDLPNDWTSTKDTTIYTVTVPGGTTLRPGRYLVSPFSPVAVGGVDIEREPVSPESLGAYTQGSLAAVTILPGTSPQPSTSSPQPTADEPGACPTYTQDDGDRIVRCGGPPDE